MSELQMEHRMFLQGFMWKKVCSFDEVFNLLKTCCQANNVEYDISDIKSFVLKINIAIKPVNMMITKGIDEISGESYYVLINTLDSVLSRMSPDYTSNELELFKKIVACIVDSDDGKVSSVTVLNLADELEKHTSKKDADEIVNKFSRDKWLLEKDGFISLSTRCILELAPFFETTYKEQITNCDICGKIVLQGKACESCGTKLHFYCVDRYFTQTQMTHPNCPISSM